ncbi:dihydrofolate reductase family protein [Brachybacterium paraconglomeratum]|uniref:dihydrofolate reductase family protein n=1 Tax=Brachybacterium paraconglomeratum TaxID=173362 RepID=UPI00248F5591|nr:dihydrofolate reductase family protein [Brachybacterium paraconglomeratum]
MMRLTVNTFLTLDGVMQAPGAADEDPSDGFTAGGWQVPYTADADFGEIVTSWLETPHTALLGRTTFEMFRAFWPQVDDSDPVARAINHTRRYVVAHAGYEPDWGETTVIDSADPLPAIARLKAEGRGN